MVPADLRDLQSGLFRKANDLALENAQPGGATVEFLALFEQSLVTDADAQERSAGMDEVAARFEQFLFAQRVQAVIKRADARQHSGARLLQAGRFGHQPHIRVQETECLMNAAEVSGTVIQQCDHKGRIG